MITTAKQTANRTYAKKKYSHGKMPVEEKIALFLPQDIVEKRSIIINNQTVKITSVDDDDFYQWYLGLVDQTAQTLPGTSYELPALKRKAKQVKYELDSDSRWYLLNELYYLKAFRKSGIQMFAQEVV